HILCRESNLSESCSEIRTEELIALYAGASICFNALDSSQNLVTLRPHPVALLPKHLSRGNSHANSDNSLDASYGVRRLSMGRQGHRIVEQNLHYGSFDRSLNGTAPRNHIYP